MKCYLGQAPLIKAQPMNLVDYNTYRGWDIPLDEDPLEKGYLIEVTDGGAPNHPQHAGRITWMTAEQFLGQYAELSIDITDRSPVEKRVFIELIQLDERAFKLSNFIKTQEYADLPAPTQRLLDAQLSTMLTYSTLLRARVAA